MRGRTPWNKGLKLETLDCPHCHRLVSRRMFTRFHGDRRRRERGSMSCAKDLNGLIFGKLRVISRAEKSKTGTWRWNCVCDCAAEKTVLVNNLSRGGSRSCHCARERKLTTEISAGLVFGKLRVISRAENTTMGASRWNCRCECGSEKTFLANNLRRGASRSCGAGACRSKPREGDPP
jgi:hypothetical protein